MVTRFVSSVAIAFLFVPSAWAAEPVAREFKIAVKAELTMEIERTAADVTATSDFRYTWERSGKERVLLLRALAVTAKQGNEERMNATMSRAGITTIEGGKKDERTFADAPAELQRLLRDTFDAPICKVELDAAGGEVKRTVVAGPGAKVAVDTGMITNCLLFHPRYAADKDEWPVEAAVSAGQGEASGKLTYTKVKGGKDGQQLVKVTGTLKADGVVAGGATIKDGKYVVSGTHTYDPTIGEWVTGTFDIELAFALTRGKQEVSAKGKMALAFEMLPAKK